MPHRSLKLLAATVALCAPSVPAEAINPTDASPVPVPGEPVVVELDTGNEPSFVAGALLAPAGRSGWLVAGTYRSAPGSIATAAVFSVAAEGGDWALAATASPDVASWVNAAVPMVDGATAVFGAAESDVGASPVWWRFDGTALDGPFAVGDPGASGTATAAATAGGVLFAVIRRERPDGEPSYDVARLTGETWTTTAVDPGVRHFSVAGIAARDTTVVLTGVGTLGTTTDQRRHAAAVVSTDGGATFRRADTSAFASAAGPTSFGPVVASADGFFAPTCMAEDSPTRYGYASTPDGVAWAARPFTDPEGILPGPNGACTAIAVDADRGVWLTTENGGGDAYRIIGDRVDRVVWLDRPAGTVLDGGQLVAVSGSTVALISQQPGGVIAGVGDRGEPWPFPGAAPELRRAGGLPGGHEGFETWTRLDEAGELVGLSTFPMVIEDADGWRWASRTRAQRIAAGGALTEDATATPLDPVWNSAIGGVVSGPSGDVSIAEIVDPPSDYYGVSGDVVISRLGADGRWSELETIAGGEGMQNVAGLTVASGAIVVVGADWITDQATRVVSGSPLVLVGDGRAFDRVELTVPASEQASLEGACALPDGRVLVVGHDLTADRPIAANVDPVRRTAALSELHIEPPPDSISTCVSTAEGVVVQTRTDGIDRLSLTLDGSEFQPLDVLSPYDSVSSIAAADEGIAVVGAAGPQSMDGFVLFGASVEELRRLDVPALRGPGEQFPQVVVVDESAILVFGADDGAPTMWPLTFG